MTPETDGIDHINVYSKGLTWLGQKLSNFADTPFIHPTAGYYRTVEGFWYDLMCNPNLQELRDAPGWKVKQIGKTLQPVREPPTKEELLIAYRAKLKAHPQIVEELKASKLPFAHYYVYGNKAVIPKEWQWTAQLWNELREEMHSTQLTQSVVTV